MRQSTVKPALVDSDVKKALIWIGAADLGLASDDLGLATRKIIFRISVRIGHIIVGRAPSFLLSQSEHAIVSGVSDNPGIHD